VSGAEPSTFELASRPVQAYRIAQWATLAALVWKIGAFTSMYQCYVRIPLDQEFFPAAFESPAVLLITYVVCVICFGTAALTANSRRRILASTGSLFTLSILCIHQGSHNDMTFATAWWTSLWSVWVASRIPLDTSESLIRKAAFVSRCVVSMILLGGAVGKWTTEYWSGQALYEIYFVDRDFWIFNLLRDNLDAESLRTFATFYSRKVIVVESVCGFGLWLLPARWAAGVAIFVLTSIALFSNFYLFSVLLSLIGLAASGFFVIRRAV